MEEISDHLYMGDSTSTTSTEKINIQTSRKSPKPIPYKYTRLLSYMATQGPTRPKSALVHSSYASQRSKSLENQIMTLPGSRCDRAFKVFGMAT
jgi:hypothetical protein